MHAQAKLDQEKAEADYRAACAAEEERLQVPCFDADVAHDQALLLQSMELVRSEKKDLQKQLKSLKARLRSVLAEVAGDTRNVADAQGRAARAQTRAQQAEARAAAAEVRLFQSFIVVLTA